MTTATLLTPPGTGAIAVIEVAGPEARAIVQAHFSKPLPPKGQFRFGRLAGDDVIVSARDEARIEIHCHGGPKIVEWILRTLDCDEAPKPTRGHGWALLESATTLRVAGILLDQLHGAFDRAIQTIRNSPTLERLEHLASLAPLGHHLLAPWKIVLAGAPNVGKSSLLNALAGFERAVVSPVAGTTRDAVTLPAAFDGWPVELTDTAGVRSPKDALEAAGIERARQVIREADFLLWVLDASADPVWPEPGERQPDLVVSNKSDLAGATIHDGTLSVSAFTGAGIEGLIQSMTLGLVPVAPRPGDAVPYTPALAEAVETAATFARTGKVDAARDVLATCLSPQD